MTTPPPHDGKTCRMCGRSVSAGRGASREHVIPAWMQRDFGLTRAKLSYTPMEADAIFAPLQLSQPNADTPHRAHTFGTLLLGSVCKGCNDGWMSALEDRARPDLTHLIKGRGQGVGNSSAVAHWTLKTAFTLTLATDPPIGRVIPSHGSYPARHAAGVPPGVAVLLHRSNREGWWFSSVGTFDVAVAGAADDDQAKAVARGGQRNAYCYFLHLGRLLLIVRYWPDNRAKLTYDGARLELVCAGGEVIDRAADLSVLDYDPLLELVFAMRTTVEVAGRAPTDFCLCGSGEPAAACAAHGHTSNLAGNWGWLT